MANATKKDKHVGFRTSQYARRTLGFYPATREHSDMFAAASAKTVCWLREQRVTARNARDKFDQIEAFACEDLAPFLVERAPGLNGSSKALAFATIFAAIGCYDAYAGSR